MDRRLSVLRAMSTITRSTDMEEFMRGVGLTSAELLETLKGLAQDGFVVKTGKGFAIAEKGNLALTALTPLPDESAFQFYLDVGRPLAVSARSIKEFYDVVNTVDADSLEFHLGRGDFENWVKTAIGDGLLARELEALRREGLKGEVLRKQLLLSLVSRFGEDVLRREWMP